MTITWEQRKLGDISAKVTRKNQDIVVDEVFTNSAEHGIISQRDYFDKDIANSENIDSYYIVEPDDFVYNPRISTLAPFGPIRRNKLNKSGAMSPLYYVFRVHDVDFGYLEYYFKTDSWYNFMHLNGNSGARSDRFAIRDDIFKEMPISMPQDIDEQHKIGSYFANLDNLITLHQRKYLWQHAIEHISMDNSNTTAWEQRKVSEITSFHKQGFYTTESYDNSKKYYLLRGTDLSNNTLKINDTPKINATEKDYQAFKVEIGDFLIVRSGGIGTYGIVYEDIPAIFGSYLINFRFDKNIVSNEFFGYFYQSEQCKNQLKSITQQSANMNINAENIKSLYLPLPELKEQQQIGSYFANLDNLITLHQRKPF